MFNCGGPCRKTAARVLKYSKEDIVPVHAKLWFSTLIVLPEDEEILDFTTGDKEFWVINGAHILRYVHPAQADTLGGLVQAGRRIHETVRSALDLGLLCSNDPVCAQHDPPNALEGRFLHGTACHGCLLIADTSCEQQNDFFDRALTQLPQSEVT